jgi:hypothetical protein
VEAVGVVAGLAGAVEAARLEPELLHQGGRREGRHGLIEGDCAHGGPRAAVDGIGDHDPAARLVGLHGDAHLAPEVAAVLVEVLDGVDALQHPLFGKGLGLSLGDGLAQGVPVEAQTAGDAHLLDLHHGAEDDHHHDSAPRGVVARIELDLRGGAGGLEVAQSVADPLLVERLADLGLDQGLELHGLVQGSVAANFDGGDDRSGGLCLLG